MRTLPMTSPARPPVEFLPGVWQLPGSFGGSFFLDPPSSNAYVVRDENTVYVLDPGRDRATRRALLDVLADEQRRGATRVRLLVTQGHFDHAVNASLLHELDVEWEFLLPEVEVPTMSSADDFERDLVELEHYEDVWTTMFARTPLAPVMALLGRTSPALARRLLRASVTQLMGRGDHLASEATLLCEADKVTRTFGSVTLRGWDVGRFFVIHDGAHSPGHVCLYDPEHRLVLAGDATVEINPAFLYSSMTGLIDITSALASLCRTGFIAYAADGHRSPASVARLAASTGGVLLHPTQGLDLMRGEEESAQFFEAFADYYRSLVEGVRRAHRAVGRATVGEIVTEFRADPDSAVRFKVLLAFPGQPSRLDVLVAQVLKEDAAPRVRVGTAILFDPSV